MLRKDTDFLLVDFAKCIFVPQRLVFIVEFDLSGVLNL
jgi:hypothetical protein